MTGHQKLELMKRLSRFSRAGRLTLRAPVLLDGGFWSLCLGIQEDSAYLHGLAAPDGSWQLSEVVLEEPLFDEKYAGREYIREPDLLHEAARMAQERLSQAGVAVPKIVIVEPS